jgi:hypothetical protein
VKEWRERKASNLHYYRKLSEFIEAHFKDMELSSETEKEITIKSLVNAYSFENAKSVVKQLRKFDNFSIKQLNDIASAFATNNQIYWIKEQYPISNVCREIIDINYEKIDQSIFSEYQRIYGN